MDMTVVINQMIILFLLMAVGYGIVKSKIMPAQFRDSLSSFIINVTMPFMMLASVTYTKPFGTAKDVLHVFIIATMTYLILPIIAYLLTRILLVPRSDRRLYMYMTIFSNIAFMGFPVIESIFGSGAIFYAAIFNLFFNLLNFSLGIILMSENGKDTISIRNFLKPGIFASILAILIFLTKVTLPVPMVNAMKVLGDATTPLAMIVIGMSLAQISFASVFTELRLYPYTIIKQILTPFLAWLVLRNIISNELILGVTIVVIAMPVGTSAVLFSSEYHNNTELATKGVFITTLSSLVTIPLIAFLLL